MNDDLVYKVADAFQTDMFHVGADIRGLIPSHQFKVGQWVAKGDVTIVVDENTDNMCSAVARIYGNLWSYFIATAEGTWLLFFDGSKAKIHVGAEREFGLGNAKASLKKLKPSITRVFYMNSLFSEVPNLWEPMDLAIVDQI